MERWAKSAPRLNGTRNDLSAFGGRISFMLVKFTQVGSVSGLLVRTLGMGRHRMADGGIENIFK